jgi:DNA-binding NtrC family response regulator
LADQIKKLHPHIQVLFMSGYSDNVITYRGVLREGVELLVKPFSLSELAVKVRQVLDSKKR